MSELFLSVNDLWPGAGEPDAHAVVERLRSAGVRARVVNSQSQRSNVNELLGAADSFRTAVLESANEAKKRALEEGEALRAARLAEAIADFDQALDEVTRWQRELTEAAARLERCRNAAAAFQRATST